MGDLTPLAFDLETAGLGPDAPITVVGLATAVGTWQALNTEGRPADAAVLAAAVDRGPSNDIEVTETEPDLLAAFASAVDDRLSADRQFVCAFNGETWQAGFDLPFLRTACVRADVDWPLTGYAYADVTAMVDRFNTGDNRDLAGVYDILVGGDAGDPFADSERAVAAHETGDWVPLLEHNLADLERTLALARLAERYVPKSDYKMKNLTPPVG